MGTRDPSDKQVEMSRPALGFLLANRNCSTNTKERKMASTAARRLLLVGRGNVVSVEPGKEDIRNSSSNS